jgi:hypothetical protein
LSREESLNDRDEEEPDDDLDWVDVGDFEGAFGWVDLD